MLLLNYFLSHSCEQPGSAFPGLGKKKTTIQGKDLQPQGWGDTSPLSCIFPIKNGLQPIEDTPELKLTAPPSAQGAPTHLHFLLKGQTFSRGSFAAGQEVPVEAIRCGRKSLSTSAHVLSRGTSLLGSRSLLKASTAGEGLSNCPHLLLVLCHEWPRSKSRASLTRR